MTPIANSIDQLVIFGLLAGIITMIFACRSRHLVSRVLLIVLAVCLLIPSAILCVGRNPWLIDARFRNFQLLYWNIRIGMSRDEVISEIHERYPSNQVPEPPRVVRDSPNELEIQMNPGASGESDNEAILLRMEEGHVMGKSYSADRSPNSRF